MNGASHPTALNARTGELTPPGISFSARSCSFRHSSSLRPISLLKFPRNFCDDARPRPSHLHFGSGALTNSQLCPRRNSIVQNGKASPISRTFHIGYIILQRRTRYGKRSKSPSNREGKDDLALRPDHPALFGAKPVRPV